MGKARKLKPIRRRNHANIVKTKKKLNAIHNILTKLESQFK